MYQPGLAVLSDRIHDMVDVQDGLLLSANQSAVRANLSNKKGQRLHVYNISKKPSEA